MPLVLNFFEKFDRLFGQFYSENHRWPHSPDELLDLNARLGGPFSPQALRDGKITLKTKEDNTLIVSFVNSSPPQALRLYPPNADGNMEKVVVLTSREAEAESK